MSAEGEAFLEATGSKRDYAVRRKQVVKIGSPDTRWVKTPVLPPILASILPRETVKEDKRSFRSQQLWLEAAPLVSLLKTAHKDKLDPKIALTMVQSALLLMGDASQHQSANRHQVILKQLNPQIVELMKEEDYAKALPFLFGEDFGAKVKARMKEAAALKKILSQPSKGKEKAGFHGGYLLKEHRRPCRWPTKCLRPWTIQEMETSPSCRQQAWKEMTRTVISNSCKQFNKICVCYPTVNTSWHPSTPHRGVDGDIRPVSNFSLPSREVSSLCKELGGNYPRPMGSAGNIRVQIGPAPNPSPGKETTCATPFPNRSYSNNTGGAGIASKTGYKGSTNLSQQFHFSTLPGGKERGWAETSCQPEGSEQFHVLRALQDGRPPYSPGFDSDWGLHDKTGSEGCIPADSNSLGSPTSPPVSVDGHTSLCAFPSD